MPDDQQLPPTITVPPATATNVENSGTWQALFRSEWRLIYGIALAASGNPTEAEDITQETFVRLVRQWPRIRDRQASLRAYLVTIALNLARDRARNTRRWAVVSTDETDLADTAPGPEEQTIRAIERAEAVNALLALPESDREVLVLRITCDMSAEEVGKRLGKSAAAIRQQQHRALVTLRSQIGADQP